MSLAQPSRLSRLQHWFITFLMKRAIFVLALLFLIGLSLALANTFQLSSNLIRTQARQNAEVTAQLLQASRTLYSADVVEPLTSVHGINAVHNPKQNPGTIPLPATYLIELGYRLPWEKGLFVRLYSDYPFPDRLESGGPQDEYERQALIHLRQNPDQPFVRFEEFDGRSSIRYAKADVMTASCVGCHNTHPDSPRQDWQVGDVRGVLEIVQPLDAFVAQTQSGIRSTFFTQGGIFGLALVGIVMVISYLRLINQDLEIRVNERTLDLQQANQALEQRNVLIRRVFGRYISDDVVANLLDDPERLKLGGERREITILTSDLRGFTAISERLKPEEVVEILNLYLNHMTDIISRYRGTIDEFMGDGILVMFGAPIGSPDHVQRAVACACAMQLEMSPINAQLAAWGFPKIEMGIGINTGEVVVGNIGSEKRAKYGIVGNHVNLTYRIESCTVGGEILISESTYQRVADILAIKERRQVKLKGVKDTIALYQVTGVWGEFNLFLNEVSEAFVDLETPLRVQFEFIEDKKSGHATHLGQIIKLSDRSAEIQLVQPGSSVPTPMKDLKLNLVIPDHSVQQLSDDIYAKVINQPASEPSAFRIRFTNRPPEVEETLVSLYESLV